MLKIALTNLEQHVCGRLNFVWLNVPFTDDEFNNAVKEIDSPVVMFVSDIDTDIIGLEIGEYPNYEELNETMTKYETLYEWEQKVVMALMVAESMTLNEALNARDDAFFYEHQTLGDVAYDLVDAGCFGDVNESIRPYIDYEAIGRDLRQDGYTEISEGDFWGVIEYR